MTPETHDNRRFSFTTVNPGLSARCHWVVIEAQEHWLEPSTVTVEIDPGARRIVATTENVSRLRFDLEAFSTARASAKKGATEPGPILLAPGESLQVELDGAQLTAPWPEGSPALVLERRGDDGWHLREPGNSDALQKGPRRAGPFKDAFRHRMVFVYATQGTPEENAWSVAKARYDAETFQYRGNGSVELMADVDLDPLAEPDRSLILYGHAGMNAAWEPALGQAPIRVGPGAVSVGDRRIERDDVACLFVYPRTGSSTASVGVVAGTGPVGLRLTNQFPYFVSGVGYPDWTVIGPEMLEQGFEGVLGAGFFGGDWSVSGGDAAWRGE